MYNSRVMKQPIWIAHDDKRVLAGTTTRHGGISKGEYSQFNLAFHTGDQGKHVLENRNKFSQLINVPISKMVFTYQSHSTNLKKVTSLDGGKGSTSFEQGIAADALYTQDKQVLLGVFHADCVPVFLIHRRQPLIAIVHAGTPGSLQGITAKVIQQLVKEVNIKPDDLTAYLGPSLDFAHHPIDETKKNQLLKQSSSFQSIIKKIGGQHYLDIPLLNYMQLIDSGLKPEHVHVSNLDTFSNEEDYFSYDRNQKTGRHVSFIYLR